MKIAQWLLTNFGVDETLHGDLMEERAAGRSALWLLRQTLAAIAVHLGRDLRLHPVLALRAIATGWLLTMAWANLVTWTQQHHQTLFAFVFLFTIFGWPAFTGWVVERTHRAQQAAMVLAYVASGVIWSAWYYTAHYAEIVRMPIPNQLGIDLALTGIMLFGTLVGGFLQRPVNAKLSE